MNQCEDIFLRYIFPYFKGDMGSPRSVLSNDVNCQPLTLEPEDNSTRTLTVRSDLSKFVKVTCYLYCSLTAIRFIIVNL